MHWPVNWNESDNNSVDHLRPSIEIQAMFSDKKFAYFKFLNCKSSQRLQTSDLQLSARDLELEIRRYV